MKLKSMIVGAAALAAVAAIPVAGAQAGGIAGVANLKGSPAVNSIVKVGHRKRHFHFHFKRYRYHYGCGYYWHMWRKTGFYHWKKKFYRCKFYYY